MFDFALCIYIGGSDIKDMGMEHHVNNMVTPVHNKYMTTLWRGWTWRTAGPFVRKFDGNLFVVISPNEPLHRKSSSW